MLKARQGIPTKMISMWKEYGTKDSTAGKKEKKTYNNLRKRREEKEVGGGSMRIDGIQRVYDSVGFVGA